MISDINRIFDEYTHLRLNGLEASEAINVLHVHIKKIDDDKRDELAMRIRAWESQCTDEESDDSRQQLIEANRIRNSQNTTIYCPQCNKSNSVNDLVCYSCESLLRNEESEESETAKLPLQAEELLSDSIFKLNNVLILVSDTDINFILRPQMGASRLTIGRYSADAPVDIDLEPLCANEKGVSRLHAAIIYDDGSQTLSLLDMNSTNGSFINEQRLHPNERRVMRHGDTLRFGRVSLNVIYKNESL